MNHKISKNAPCPCGSGKKFKKCCINKKHISKIKENRRKRKDIKKWFSVIIVFMCLATAIFSYFFLQKPAPASVSGSITSVGNVATFFDSFMFKQFSPGCGCITDDEWRGIGVFSRSLNLSTGTNKQNLFIVSPAPSSIDMLPGFAFDATIYKFKAKPDINGGFITDFNREELFRSDFSHPSITYKLKLKKKIFFHLRGKGQLGIFQKGAVPLAVWNPGKKSPIFIENDNNELKLIEQYETKRSNDFRLSTGIAEIVNEYPVLDLLGSPTLFWGFETLDVSVNDDTEWDEFKSISYGKDQDEKSVIREYIAIVVESPFATRLINIPYKAIKNNTPNNYIGVLTCDISKKEDFILFTVEDDNVITELELANEHIETSNILFVDNVISAANIFKNFPLQHYKIETTKFPFQYPKLPEFWGFSIYGRVHNIILGGAKGSLMINGSNRQIGARSSISLLGADNLSPYSGSISLMPNGLTEFKAKADVIYINDEIAHTYFDKYFNNIAIFLTILGILGFTPIIISLFKYFVKTKEQLH